MTRATKSPLRNNRRTTGSATGSATSSATSSATGSATSITANSFFSFLKEEKNTDIIRKIKKFLIILSFVIFFFYGFTFLFVLMLFFLERTCEIIQMCDKEKLERDRLNRIAISMSPIKDKESKDIHELYLRNREKEYDLYLNDQKKRMDQNKKDQEEGKFHFKWHHRNCFSYLSEETGSRVYFRFLYGGKIEELKELPEERDSDIGIPFGCMFLTEKGMVQRIESDYNFHLDNDNNFNIHERYYREIRVPHSEACA
jgi:hypothetical protein